MPPAAGRFGGEGKGVGVGSGVGVGVVVRVADGDGEDCAADCPHAASVSPNKTASARDLTTAAES